MVMKSRNFRIFFNVNCVEYWFTLSTLLEEIINKNKKFVKVSITEDIEILMSLFYVDRIINPLHGFEFQMFV